MHSVSHFHYSYMALKLKKKKRTHCSCMSVLQAERPVVKQERAIATVASQAFFPQQFFRQRFSTVQLVLPHSLHMSIM